MASFEPNMDWVDRVLVETRPKYLGIVAALGEAVRTGMLHPGDRLPAQRLVAERLGVDLTTVTRAYAVAKDRGLLAGKVGKGSFVRGGWSDDSGIVDLSMNLPPAPKGVFLGWMLSETSTAILQSSDAALLMSYHADFGTPGQKAAGCRWVAPTLGEVAPERVLLTPGAQVALCAVLSVLAKPGQTIVVEPLTYPGIIAAASTLGLRLVHCASDGDGLAPDALKELCAREKPAAVYVVPTLQNPTATTMPAKRRLEIARIVEQDGTFLVEDDPYSPLVDTPLKALGSSIPDHAFYISTLAKSLSPGLRIAFAVCPKAWSERVAAALRAIALMPAPLMAAIATRWINDGSANTILEGVRLEIRARRALASTILPTARGDAESIHVWLPTTDLGSADRIVSSAQKRGLALVSTRAFAVAPNADAGVRISLGGASNLNALNRTLESLKAALDEGCALNRQVV